jgi:hypothetical protein
MTIENVSVSVSELIRGGKPGYTIEVSLPSLKCVVQRSADSFLKLDSNLGKIFPNTKLPVSLRSQRDSEAVTRRSSFTQAAPTNLTMDDANDYIQALLKLPEILTSDILLSFLDEESSDGEMLDFSEEGSSGVDVLLSNKGLVKKTVLKCHTVTHPVKAGDVVVWKFRTKKHDIGFSIDLDGVEVITYERVNSHEKVVCGLFEIPQGLSQRTKDKEGMPSSLKIFFDNSYSKLRAKDLRYSCGVYTKCELEAAQAAANKKNEEKKRYIKQRILLQESLQAMAKELSGLRGDTGNLTTSSHRGSGGHNLAALLASQQREEEKEELERILEEKASLMSAYQEALLVLQEEKKTAASALQRVETLLAQQNQLEDELLAASAEVETFRERAESAQTHLQSNQEVLMEALGHSKSSEEVEVMLTRALETKDKELVETRGDLEDARLAFRTMEETLSKTVSERKQLKQYGKTAKAEIERLKAENSALSEESAASEKDLRFARDQLEEAHAEILRLQVVEAKHESEMKDLKTALEQAHARTDTATSICSGGAAACADPTMAAIREGSEADSLWEGKKGTNWETCEKGEMDADLDGWKVGGDVSGPLNKDRSTEVGALERRDTKELSPEVYCEGKWYYVPPPRLVKSTTAGFYGF